MIRPWYAVRYLAFVVTQVVVGALRVAVDAVTPGFADHPAIVEFAMRCRTDLEITVMASSITITPGTLVLGIAPAEGDAPPALFVHGMYAGGRERLLAELTDMEDRLLRMTRGRTDRS